MAQTLSLVALSVVLVVLVTAMIVVWYSLTRSAVAVVEERLGRSVKQLAVVTAAGLRQAQPRYAAVARDTAIQRVLVNPRDTGNMEGVVAALGRLSTLSDSGLPIELWNAAGRRVAFIGDDVQDVANLDQPRETGQAPNTFRPGLDSLRPIDSLQLGALYWRNDRAYFWIVLPVWANGKPLGYLAQERRIAINTQTEQTIRELSGDSAFGYYHNVDGTAWTTFGGAHANPPLAVAGTEGALTRPGLGRLIYSEEHIPGTPLVLTMEVPRRVVVAAAMATVRRLVAFSAILTAAGALVAWWAGRRVVRPLAHLTTAAESIARGDYAARVPVVGPHEVARLATSFNMMAAQVGESRAQSRTAQEAAETANRAKSDFLAAMSHELRTPLNAIGGYAELMEMGLRGPVTPEQKKDLNRIRNSQHHLLGLVGRILDLNRIERGEVVYEHASIAIDPLLIGLEDLVFPQAHAKQQTLDYKPADRDLVVIADREKLRQIVINLLSNAIRHSPNGGAITIGAHRVAPDGKLIAIVVSDSGPGIPADRQEAIFEPFVQLDRSFTSSIEGVGLGLAISRDLARGMGGDLTVHSEPGTGARFTLTLPAGTLDGNTQMARTLETKATRGE
jgi:signal transduction histidine kinase